MIQTKTKSATVFESALYRTTSTVIHTPDLLLVVDPNWLPAEVKHIQNLLERLLQKQPERPVFLLFIHSDYDHIIGYRAFPGAAVIASQAFAENPEKEAVVQQIIAWDQEYYIRRDYPVEYPAVDFPIKTDGQQLTIGGTTLTFYLAPGHTRDGIFTIVEPAGIWLAGDYLCDVEFPYIYHSSMAYEHTLDKARLIVKQHKIKMLVPGHGKVANRQADILQRIEEARSYISELRKCIGDQIPFNLEKLWQRYCFPLSMLQFHLDNEALMKKEVHAGLA